MRRYQYDRPFDHRDGDWRESRAKTRAADAIAIVHPEQRAMSGAQNKALVAR